MEFELYGIGAVALCMALVSLAKKVGFPPKYSPILALVIGIAEGLVVYGETNIPQGLVLGIAAGLSAEKLLDFTPSKSNETYQHTFKSNGSESGGKLND